MASILEIDVTVEPSEYKDAVINALKSLRPAWQEDQLQITELPGGLVNAVYLISCTSASPNDKVVLKLLSPAMIDTLDLESEYTILAHLTHHTQLVQLYCRFQNGFLYKYFPGRLINVSELQDASISRKIYEKLHEIHAVALPVSMKNGAEKYDCQVPISKQVLKVLRSEQAALLDQDERIVSAGLSSKKILQLAEQHDKDFEAMKASQRRVLCHGDPRMHNIIIDENTANVALIDWDNMGVRWELLDLAVTLARDPVYTLRDANLLPYQNEAFFDKQLSLYLETHPQYRGHSLDTNVFKEWKKMLL